MKEHKKIVIDKKEYEVFEKGEYFITEKGRWYRLEEDSRLNGSSGIYNMRVSDEHGKIWFLKFFRIDSNEKKSWQINNLRRESKFRFFYPYIEHVSDAFYGRLAEQISEKQILAEGIIDKRYYAVCMEYVEGSNLAEYIEKQKKLLAAKQITLEEVERQMFRYMMQFLYGINYYINYAEDAYIHRDLKPENIMICEKEDKIVIIDFDNSHISGSTATDNRESNVRVGLSRGYIAPDAVVNANVDCLAEIYSIGRIFCYWLKGESYFRDEERQYISDEEECCCPVYCMNTKLGYGFEENRFHKRYREPKYKKLLQIIRKMCDCRENRYQSISEIIFDMKEFLWEFCGKSVKERELFLQSDKMPLLKEREERREEKAPQVSYKVLSDGTGRSGTPLLEYSMRKIKVDGELVMTIYNIKNVIYYIPTLMGKEIVREREGKDFEIQSEDIFKIGDLKIQFYIE